MDIDVTVVHVLLFVVIVNMIVKKVFTVGAINLNTKIAPDTMEQTDTSPNSRNPKREYMHRLCGRRCV